jgi:hypothetical protein
MSMETLIGGRTVSLQSGIEVVLFVWLLPAVLLNVAILVTFSGAAAIAVVDVLLIAATVTVLKTRPGVVSVFVFAGVVVVVVTAAVISFVVVVISADVVVPLTIVVVVVMVLVGAVG